MADDEEYDGAELVTGTKPSGADGRRERDSRRTNLVNAPSFRGGEETGGDGNGTTPIVTESSVRIMPTGLLD